MPPKKAAAAEGEDAGGMTAGDSEFLLACLRHITGGAISIDIKAVAEERGSKNPRSITNRLSALKKKYNLPLGTNGTSASTDGATGLTTPKKITKSRAKNPKKVTKKGKETASDEDDEDKIKGETEDDEMVDEDDEAEAEV